MTTWDRFFEEKLKLIATAQDILDVGSGRRFGKILKDYEPLFRKNNYKTLDISSEYNPDIVGDIHNIPLADKSVGGIICNAVLEHVYDPQKAVNEIYRILKDGGMALLYVPFLYPYHANKNCPDYYRFTKDGIHYLFRQFSKIEVVPVRGFWEMWFYFLPFRLNRILAPTIGRFLDRLKKQRGNQASGYSIYVVK